MVRQKFCCNWSRRVCENPFGQAAPAASYTSNMTRATRDAEKGAGEEEECSLLENVNSSTGTSASASDDEAQIKHKHRGTRNQHRRQRARYHMPRSLRRLGCCMVSAFFGFLILYNYLPNLYFDVQKRHGELKLNCSRRQLVRVISCSGFTRLVVQYVARHKGICTATTEYGTYNAAGFLSKQNISDYRRLHRPQ